MHFSVVVGYSVSISTVDISHDSLYHVLVNVIYFEPCSYHIPCSVAKPADIYIQSQPASYLLDSAIQQQVLDILRILKHIVLGSCNSTASP